MLCSIKSASWLAGGWPVTYHLGEWVDETVIVPCNRRGEGAAEKQAGAEENVACWLASGEICRRRQQPASAQPSASVSYRLQPAENYRYRK